MENADYSAKLVKRLVEGDVFRRAPFVLIDVGCSGGIDSLWRQFLPDLCAHGLDPQAAECGRLEQSETAPDIHYHAFLVGLPEDHPFRKQQRAEAAASFDHEGFWQRTSAGAAWARQAAPVQSNPLGDGLTEERIAVSQFVARQGLDHVDFVKIDTDGGDYEALISCEPILRSHHVLGVMIETPFVGSAHETQNTFHNIDRWMRQHGFTLFDMTVNRYSRRELPLPFRYRILAQTEGGQPLWGDLVYLRDAAVSAPDVFWPGGFSREELLKLAALFELFRLPDCAAELLLRHREALAPVVAVGALLDLLTPPLGEKQLSYREYVARFERDVEAFLPAPGADGEPPVPGIREASRELARAVRKRFGKGAS